ESREGSPVTVAVRAIYNLKVEPAAITPFAAATASALGDKVKTVKVSFQAPDFVFAPNSELPTTVKLVRDAAHGVEEEAAGAVVARPRIGSGGKVEIEVPVHALFNRAKTATLFEKGSTYKVRAVANDVSGAAARKAAREAAQAKAATAAARQEAARAKA